MDSCTQMLAARYDDKLGGFGNAPKFPRPSELNLLLVHHIRTKAAGSKAEASECLLCIFPLHKQIVLLLRYVSLLICPSTAQVKTDLNEFFPCSSRPPGEGPSAGPLFPPLPLLSGRL